MQDGYGELYYENGREMNLVTFEIFSVGKKHLLSHFIVVTMIGCVSPNEGHRHEGESAFSTNTYIDRLFSKFVAL